MNERQQMQLIVDRLTGQARIQINPAALSQPWRTIYQGVRPATSLDEAGRILGEAAAALEDGPTWVRVLLALTPGDAFRPDPSLAVLADHLQAPRWLWPNWIPLGLITLLGAAPGVGKSLLALDLAARLVSNLPFPDNAPPFHSPEYPESSESAESMSPEPTVLMIDADANPALLTDRARAWGFDLQRVYPFLPPPPAYLIDLTDDTQQLCLMDLCRRHRPSLVVVDSLSAACPGTESNLTRLRDTLLTLEALARDGDFAVLIIHHLRKRRGAAALRPIAAGDLRGHGHLTAAARSVLALSPMPPPIDRPTAILRRLEVVKTNLCAPPPPLSVDLTHAPRLRYAPLPVLSTKPPPPSAIDLCATWLLALLREVGEPMRPLDVVSLANDAGFSRRTLYRARHSLGEAIVENSASLRDSNKTWSLADLP